MRTLAIDCSTEACSVALFEDERLLAAQHEVLGRGHAEKLVPMVAALDGRGQAERILVSLGPGSFTGVRVGLAAARALAIAWQSNVLGYPGLALIAAMARGDRGEPVSVCMNGGHGEWFVQDFDAAGLPENAVASLTPNAVATRKFHDLIAGNRAAECVALCGDNRRAIELLPDARHALSIPEVLLTDRLVPEYGRRPDARLPA